MEDLNKKRPITLADFFYYYNDWDETRLNLCFYLQIAGDLTPEGTFKVLDELEELDVINQPPDHAPAPAVGAC